jgi:hypothetical protein
MLRCWRFKQEVSNEIQPKNGSGEFDEESDSHTICRNRSVWRGYASSTGTAPSSPLLVQPPPSSLPLGVAIGR